MCKGGGGCCGRLAILSPKIGIHAAAVRGLGHGCGRSCGQSHGGRQRLPPLCQAEKGGTRVAAEKVGMLWRARQTVRHTQMEVPLRQTT